MSNLKAFLDTIAFSEGTAGKGDDGYNVLVGGALFDSYADHPRIHVMVRPGLISTAAGRYQILEGNYDFYRKSLNLPDFGHESQDHIATQLIRECLALDDVLSGHFEFALRACKSRWASLPGAGYDQPERSLADLRGAYLKSGGVLA